MINKLPFYRKQTVKLALEFGLVLSEVANEKKIELTGEITERAEKIFLNEINTRGMKRTALSFAPLILAALEV